MLEGSVLVFLQLGEGDYLLVGFVHKGPGIAEESVKHIFDKFFQVDSSHKQEGNGLGLALAKKIVSLNSGEITVENRDAGGCRFTVELPLVFR